MGKNKFDDQRHKLVVAISRTPGGVTREQFDKEARAAGIPRASIPLILGALKTTGNLEEVRRLKLTQTGRDLASALRWTNKNKVKQKSRSRKR